MTVADLLVLIAGFAVILRIIFPSDRRPGPAGIPDVFTSMMIGVTVLVAAASVMPLVSLERQIVYRRPARAAEWIAIMFASVAAMGLMQANGIIPRAKVRLFGDDPLPWQRGLPAAICLVLIIASLVALAWFGKRLPHWAKTIWLALLAMLWFWGPVEAILLHFPGSILPPSGRDPFESTWLAWIHYEALNFVITMPFWLLFSVPAVAALLERRAGRRSWIWTEWIGAGVPLILGGVLLTFLYWPTGSAGGEQIALRVVVPFWILGAGGISWLIIRCWARLAKNGESAAE